MFHWSDNWSDEPGEVSVAEQPNTELITLAEAKVQCEVEVSDTYYDDWFNQNIAAARQYIQKICRRTIVPTGWLLTMDGFPHPQQIIRLRMPPVISVDLFTYLDPNGNEQTLTEGTDYQLDLTSDISPRIAPAVGKWWPATQQLALNAVKIYYSAGWIGSGTDSCNSWGRGIAKNAMLLLVSHWFYNRQAATERELHEAPLAVENLLWTLRVSL